MVFNATFNSISVILWRSVLLVEETRVPRENHRPVAYVLESVLNSCWLMLGRWFGQLSGFILLTSSCFTRKMAEESWPVKVYIYDVSKGMARSLSQAFIGKISKYNQTMKSTIVFIWLQIICGHIMFCYSFLNNNGHFCFFVHGEFIAHLILIRFFF